MFRRGLLTALLVACLAAFPQAAAAAELIGFGNMARVSFDPNAPAPAVEFQIDGQTAAVRIAAAGPADGPLHAQPTWASEPDGRTARVVWTLPQGGRAELSVRLSTTDPAASLTWSAPPDLDLKLTLAGADRVVYPRAEGFGVIGIEAGSIREVGSMAAFQDRATQTGLALTAGPEATLSVDGSKVTLSGGPAPAVVGVAAFQGDAILALEQTAPPGPVDVVAVSTTPPPAEAETGPFPLWNLWPDTGRAFRPLKADPREAYFRFGFMNQEGETLEDMSFGGDLGIYEYAWSDRHRLTLTGRGLFTARFDVHSESFDLLNVDFVGGPALGYRYGPHQAELFVYHQSSHAGDEITARGRQPIDYSRETARLLYAYNWKWFRFYAGPSYHLHAMPDPLDQKWIMQGGAEFTYPIFERDFFIAADVQSRQAHDWKTNTTVQVGYEIVGRPELTRNRQWLFAEFFWGYSNMGQFWDQWESYQMLGIGYRFR
jgi:hypothetical protein